MTEERRMLAHRVIYTLWPDMPLYDKNNVTPELATYVFILYERARKANALIQAMRPLLNLSPTSEWKDIPQTLVDAVRSGVNANFDERGWAVQSIIALHGSYVRKALQYGPDVYPLELNRAFLN